MKKYTPGSGNIYLFDNLGGGDYSRLTIIRGGATIRGNTVCFNRIGHMF